eukprot:6106493-Pleurochrysis_carterae.AAC.2
MNVRWATRVVYAIRGQELCELRRQELASVITVKRADGMRIGVSPRLLSSALKDAINCSTSAGASALVLEPCVLRAHEGTRDVGVNETAGARRLV